MTLKTSWSNVRIKANVKGRWHDNRHTLITDSAESGAADETIRDIAGHVSKQMLKHYSHIRMTAKRSALEGIVAKPKLPAAGDTPSSCPESRIVAITKPLRSRRSAKPASAALEDRPGRSI